MSTLTIKDYENAIALVKDFISTAPKEIMPEIAIHNGHIKNPGISDIDLIFVFKDDFLLSEYFLYMFSKKMESLEHKALFFHHPPHIYPLSSINELPYMTYNPVKELKILKGDVNFVASDTNDYQNILNSFEQIHNRIVTLVSLKHSDKKNIYALLLTGHSMIHTFNCLKALGSELNMQDFTNLQIVEDARKNITSGSKNISLDYDKLCLGLISEFSILLNWLNSFLEKKIILHFSKEKNIYQYDNNVFFININSIKKDLKFKYNNNNLYIEGFSWQTLCLLENYFCDENNYITIFDDYKLHDEIKKRKEFIKKIISFNFKNYNSASGRTGLHPLVRNNRFNWLARQLEVI